MLNILFDKVTNKHIFYVVAKIQELRKIHGILRIQNKAGSGSIVNQSYKSTGLALTELERDTVESG